jgi:predicted dehydrogenase
MNHRRAFLRTAAIATAAIAVGQRDNRSQSTAQKAAVIGHTGRGDYGHGLDLIFKDLPGITVVAVADAAVAGREKAKERIGAAKAYADYREMLAAEKPGLVSVAPRWTEEHLPMVKAALETGAHVFCEKPFTMTVRDSDELLALANKNGLRIAVSHQMRMAPSVVTLQDKLSDIIGELVQMRAFGKQDARAGGEDMLVLGTHLFDLMRMFAGDARRCSSTIWSKGKLATQDDRRKASEGIGYVLGDEIEAQFQFDRGVFGSFTSRAKLREFVAHWRLELIGTHGAAMILADIEPQVLVMKPANFAADGRKDDWSVLQPANPGDKGTAAANRRLALDWLKAIDERREPTCSGANAAKAVEMVMAVYESHLSAKRVDLPLRNREHPLGV